MRKRYWMIPVLLIVCMIACIIFVFRFQILIHLAPKIVLTSAVTDVLEQMDDRFQSDPLKIFLDALSPEGLYTIAANAESANTRYELTCSLDSVGHQASIQGAVVTEDGTLDLSGFLSSRFMAVTSQDLLGGTYFGITYDTFLDDIRTIPLLSLFVSDSRFSQWDQSLQSIQTAVSKDYPLLHMPDWSNMDWKTVALGVLTLPCDVEQRQLRIENEDVSCYVISYQGNTSQLKTFVSNPDIPDNVDLTVSFYLLDSELIYIQINLEEGEAQSQYTVFLGTEPRTNDLRFRCRSTDTDLSVILMSEQDSREYAQTVSVRNHNDIQEYRYTWNPSTHQMRLAISQNQISADFLLYPLENGFRMESQDFRPLLSVITQEKPIGKKPIAGWIEVTPGREINVPAYKNLSEWSLEDFLFLLENIGSLLGIQLRIG